MLCKRSRTLCLIFAAMIIAAPAMAQEKQKDKRRPMVRRENPEYRAAQSNKKWWGGGSISYWNLMQGERTLNTPGGETYNISSLASTTPNFHAFLAIPFPRRFTMVPSISMRTTQFRGDSTLQGLTDAREVKLDQSLIAVGVYFKHRFNGKGSLWWGWGGEMAKGTSVKLNIGGQNYTMTSADLPFFMTLTGHLGYDIPLKSGFYFSPEVRGGIIANTQPMIYSVELLANAAYRF